VVNILLFFSSLLYLLFNHLSLISQFHYRCLYLHNLIVEVSYFRVDLDLRDGVHCLFKVYLISKIFFSLFKSFYIPSAQIAIKIIYNVFVLLDFLV
jgi:hypothetical protein